MAVEDPEGAAQGDKHRKEIMWYGLSVMLVGTYKMYTVLELTSDNRTISGQTLHVTVQN